MQRQSLIIALLFCGLYQCFGQLGVRVSYGLQDVSTWDALFSTSENRDIDLFDRALLYQMDYRLPLKEKRIEFYPILSYTDNAQTINPALTVSLRRIGLGLESHIYLLDLDGDCDCPTFHRSGNPLQKGFFIMGGIHSFMDRLDLLDFGPETNFSFQSTIGMGIDFGISEKFTVSPFFQFRYSPNISWQALDLHLVNENDVGSALRSYNFGIRVSIL